LDIFHGDPDSDGPDLTTGADARRPNEELMKNDNRGNGKKVLLFAPDKGGCGFYRQIQPGLWLAQLGHEVRTFSLENWGDICEDNTSLLRWPDVCIFSRVMSYEALEVVADYNPDATLVFDLDDDMFQLPAENPAAARTSPQQIEALRGNLYMADLVTTTTEILAERLREYAKRVEVIPNAIDPFLFGWPRHQKDHLRVGWAGSITHNRDVRPAIEGLAEAVKEWNKKSPDLPVIPAFMGYLAQPMSKMFERVVWQNPVVFDEYYIKLHGMGMDIGLAPIRPHPFNEAKSDVKFLEYTAMGAATIASEVGPYKASIENEKTGLLVRRHDNPKEWREKILWLLEDAALREGLVNNARKFCKERRHPLELARRFKTFITKPRAESAVKSNLRRDHETRGAKTKKGGKSGVAALGEAPSFRSPSKVGVGIVSWCPEADERLENLYKCVPIILARLAQSEAATPIVRILSQGSCKEAREFLTREVKIAADNDLDVKLDISDKNEGVSAIDGIFRGLWQTHDVEYFLKIDDDVIACRGFLDIMVEAYEELIDSGENMGMLAMDPRWGVATFGTRDGFKCVDEARILSGGHWVHFLKPNSTAVGMLRLESAESYIQSGGHPTELMYGTDQVMADRFTAAGYRNAHIIPAVRYRPGGELVAYPLMHTGATSEERDKFKKVELKKMPNLRASRKLEASPNAAGDVRDTAGSPPRPQDARKLGASSDAAGDVCDTTGSPPRPPGRAVGAKE